MQISSAPVAEIRDIFNLIIIFSIKLCHLFIRSFTHVYLINAFIVVLLSALTY